MVKTMVEYLQSRNHISILRSLRNAKRQKCKLRKIGIEMLKEKLNNKHGNMIMQSSNYKKVSTYNFHIFRYNNQTSVKM
jgi:hypothetical protein